MVQGVVIKGNLYPLLMISSINISEQNLYQKPTQLFNFILTGISLVLNCSFEAPSLERTLDVNALSGEALSWIALGELASSLTRHADSKHLP